MGGMATRRTPSSSRRRLVTDALTKKKKKRTVKMVNNPNRTRASLLRRINPKASRKKLKSGGGGGASSRRNQFRMSNFRSSLKKKSSDTNAGDKLRQVRPRRPAPTVSSTTTTTTTSTVFALISTSTTTSSTDSSSSGSGGGRQLSIAMYQQKNVDHHHPAIAASTKTTSRATSKMTCDLKHMVESIERVASGQQWIDTLVAASSSSSDSSSSSSSSSDGRNKKSSIHLRNRNVNRTTEQPDSPPPSGSRRRPNQRRRLACLNAMAKVHCLYESEVRHPSVAHKNSTATRSSSSDSSSSSSSEDDSSSSETTEKVTATKKSSSKKQAVQQQSSRKKQRQSMEVPVVDLSALVMPKRMASLNATAILAASSQQWPDSPRRVRPTRVIPLSSSESEDEEKKEESKTAKSNCSPASSKKKKAVANKKKMCHETTSVQASTSLRLSTSIFHQEVDGHKTTTTYHQSGSENNGITSSSKSFHRQITTSSGPSSTPTDAAQQQETKQQPTQLGDGYSPLGALFNMRPPNSQQQQQQQQQVTSSEISSSTNLPFSSSGSSSSAATAKVDKAWPSERVTASSLPSVTFGGVPLVLSNPIQSAESYMTAARLTPAFSLYRPPIDIPYASFYPPPPPVYPAAHFAASPYYRGFALLPPPGSGFVPVALADSYSAYALAAPPPPLAGPTNADLAHYLHRYQTLGPPPCSPLTRYLPTPSPCGLAPDWRLTRESSRSVVELSSSSAMHDDRNPLPLAAAEAAASSSNAANSSTTGSGSNTGPKVEAGSTASLNHPLLLSQSSARNFCPFPAGPPIGAASSAVAAAAAAAAVAMNAVYAPRCLHSNCSCAGQSSPNCPKNVQAGPLTGEGKRSGPNSISHSVIPHPSCQVTPVQSPMGGGAGSSSSSPAVPSLPPELLFHATGPLETAADPQPKCTSIRNEDEEDEMQQQNNNNNNTNNNNNRKRKSMSDPFPPSPVSSRLRSRINSHNDGNVTSCRLDDCSTTCCCHCDLGNHPTTNSCTSLTPQSLDNSVNLHSTLSSQSQEMEKSKRLGSDIFIAFADKLEPGRKRRRKELLHRDDFGFLEKLNQSSLQMPKPNGVKKCRDKLSLPDVVKSRVMDDPSKKPPGKKTAKMKTKENSKVAVRAISPGIRQLQVSADATVRPASRRGRSKSRSPLMPPSSSPVLRWSNGWSWEGNSFQSVVQLRNEQVPAVRKCYPAMRHTQGDVVRMRDCILLKSGTKAKDLPFVAKVAFLWENADDGEMMMSLLWYYRPEHTEGGRRPTDLEDEIFASRHQDVCSVACIEDKCYVLTFNEYCRYRKQAVMTEQGLLQPSGVLMPSVVAETSDYPRLLRLPPPATATDRVFLCRKVFDFRQKRILKNPS